MRVLDLNVHNKLRSPWVLVAAGLHRNGGMDKANLALAEFLVEQETPVHVVCHDIDASLARHPLVRAHLVPRPARSFLLGEPLLDTYGRIIAARVTKRSPHARVVVNGGNCLWPGINWVHYVHHAWQQDVTQGPAWFAMKNAIARRLAKIRERSAFRRAKLLIANSQRTSTHLTELVGVDPRRISTVYLGSESSAGLVRAPEREASRRALRIVASRSVAVFVGALGYDQRKGLDILLEVWSRLCKTPEWDVDLLVVGGGNALKWWQERITQRGLQHRVRILGFSESVNDLLAAADLLISPVRYESYGLNVHEAICRGIPAMVSRSAGVAERFGSQFADMLIPDPDDVAQIVQMLREWRRCKEEWRARFQSFGDALRRRSWRDMAREFVAVVEEAEHQTAAADLA